MHNIKKKLRAGVIGATGMVGQRFLALLENHPYFDGAEKSTMGELANWVVDSDKVLTF